jgi:predicted O-methyltransferase YrrM
MKKLTRRLYSNLKSRFRLLRIAVTNRYIWSDVVAMAREHGIEYRDVTGDIEPFQFSRWVFGKDDDRLNPPDFQKALGSLQSLTPSGVPGAYNSESNVGQFLGRLAFYRRPATVVELGCFVGWTSAHLALALVAVGGGSLYCVEPDEKFRGIATANLKRLGLDGVTKMLAGTSLDSSVIASLPTKIDIVFVDSSHEYEDTCAEIELYSSRLTEGGCMVLHDSLSFPGVRRAIFEAKEKFRVMTFATEQGNGITVMVKA